MGTSTVTTLIEPSAMSNRRQPVRQTRTNPARNVTTARTLGVGSYGAQPETTKPEIAPGFFPGVMHFTDSITALPKEMVRHYTMLKEVDAKIYHPEEALMKLVGEALKGPPPVPASSLPNNLQTGSDTQQGEAGTGATDQTNLDLLFDRQHRELHMQLRFLANSMLVTLDEKNHVIGNATDQLEKQIARCESSWTAIENEISETTRIGNLDHWAYTNNAAPEKKASASESRPRREAANNNIALTSNADLDGRYDGRTVLGSRKHRLVQNDSDFDEPRPGKRAATGKGKKPEYTSAPTAAGLGISNGTSSKKRKAEKPAGGVGGHAMDRSTSSLYGTSNRGGSPRDTPALEASKKRNRATGGAMSAVFQGGRKRAGTGNSAANSPNLASSPVAGSFTSAPKGANSPAMSAAIMQRTGSTRARQNSTNTSQPAKPPPTTAKDANGSGISAGVTPTSAPKATEAKTSKNEETAQNEVNTRAGVRSTDRGVLKREESTNSRHRPPSIATGTRNNGKASKTATPVAASFPETTRPRAGRSTNAPAPGADPPPKRSHKKGAGINAQAAAAAKAAAEAARAAAEDEISEVGEDDEGADGEPLYCYCQRVSYGEMIACDWPKCKREWFHLACVSLDKVPRKDETWYCRDCAPLAAAKRR